MRNPFRSEADALRFLVFLLVAAAPVVLAAAFGPTWLALTLLGFALAAPVLRILRPRRSQLRLRTAPAHVGAANERRVLVVANDTLGERGLARELERLASAERTEVQVLAPALVSGRARWTGGGDAALVCARARLLEAIDGLDVTGWVSDADPLQAIEDSLATFPADELIVSTRRERPWEGLEPRLAGLASERFALPVRHLVSNPEQG